MPRWVAVVVAVGVAIGCSNSTVVPGPGAEPDGAAISDAEAKPPERDAAAGDSSVAVVDAAVTADASDAALEAGVVPACATPVTLPTDGVHITADVATGPKLLLPCGTQAATPTYFLRVTVPAKSNVVVELTSETGFNSPPLEVALLDTCAPATCGTLPASRFVRTLLTNSAGVTPKQSLLAVRAPTGAGRVDFQARARIEPTMARGKCSAARVLTAGEAAFAETLEGPTPSTAVDTLCGFTSANLYYAWYAVDVAPGARVTVHGTETRTGSWFQWTGTCAVPAAACTSTFQAYDFSRVLENRTASVERSYFVLVTYLLAADTHALSVTSTP